ncbi:MAG: SDR family oxidoreductase [Gemmatimonadetes bacterium]|nr:SDR family oxidoreductase [Gemmatimonadota bacterium]
MTDFDGRRVLVTGAASGIGAACLEAFRAHGAHVVGVDRSVDEATGLVVCDVTSEEEVRAAFDRAGSVTDVVHCAGVLAIGDVVDTSPAEFAAVIDVNLVGSFVVAREAARRLPTAGSLTLLSSQAGRTGGGGWSAYCASKFGVIGFGESLAQELAPSGIRVNMVCPGTVATPMLDDVLAIAAQRRGVTLEEIRARYLDGVPLGRFADPAEIAGVCVMLASPASSYITGASIVVDGGELS